MRTTSRNDMSRFLKRMGIRVATRSKPQFTDTDERFMRQYRIPLFDLKPLACFRSDTGPAWINQRMQRIQDSFFEVTSTEDKTGERARHLAVRTLHALGLDFGLVSIGLGQKGALYVLDVTPNPVLRGRMLDLFTDAWLDVIDRERRVLEDRQVIELGTDIEIMLRSAQSGKMVLASNYFSRRGRIGCDDRSIHFDGKRLPLMELRPDSHESPLGLLTNLRETMLDATQLINRANVEWRAGSMPFRPFCTGGHIHFSGVELSSLLVKALDNYVGLPLMMVENPETATLRRPKYGFLGDVREKSHGGFEYRTPASFVVSPEITGAAFCLAYIVAMSYRDLPIFDIYDLSAQTAFYHADEKVLRPIVLRNMEIIQGQPLYERYRDYIEPLVEMIERDQIWEEDHDIRLAWGLPLRKKVTQKSGRRRREAARA